MPLPSAAVSLARLILFRDPQSMARIFRRSDEAPKRSLWQRIKDVAMTDVRVVVGGGVKQGSLEDVEEILLQSDFGVPVTLSIVAQLERYAQRGQIRNEDEFLEALWRQVEAELLEGNSNPALNVSAQKPTVILVIGVNGAGKTTFIGKLASRLRGEGKRVLVGAADTFRAGAIDQLRVWADRAGADFVGGKAGSDPAAVAFDAVDAGVTRGADVVIIDTAGRLHTSGGLMEELRKINRVIGKRLPDAPHETLLVLDGTIGQNAVSQAKTFAESVRISGLVVTKVDGSAKGGVVLAVHQALNVPVKFLGVGEKATDLETFDAGAFARELLER
jgi:fused signal recognition particle receptor